VQDEPVGRHPHAGELLARIASEAERRYVGLRAADPDQLTALRRLPGGGGSGSSAG
jgi:hypothetical protein